MVLGFIAPPGAGTSGRPVQTLFGFERVHVEASESRSVNIYPAVTELAATTEDGERYPLEGTYRISFGVKEAAEIGGMGHVCTSLIASL